MRYLLLFFIFISIVQCHLPNEKNKAGTENLIPAEKVQQRTIDNLYQTWEVVDAEHPKPKDLMNYGDVQGIVNYPGLVFLTDSVIVENPRGEIRFGKFIRKEKHIEASFMDGEKATYLIGYTKEKRMELKRIEKGRETLLALASDGTLYPDAKKNPFDIAYNQWRLKPNKKEDIEMLRKRLKQYVEFYAVFFNDVLQKHVNQINFEGLPCCFNWYSGGISVQSEKTIDPKFLECFYNKEQALQARQMLEDVIMKKYKWDEKETNWIKQDVPVLQQIRDSI